MNRTWRTIAGWPYEVSCDGKVRRITPARNASSGHELALFVRSNGYVQVILHQPHIRRRYLVHRLVAEAFISPAPSVKHEIAHKNGVRSDNRAENLQWVTHVENEAHKKGHGTLLRGSKVGTSVLDEGKVAKIKQRLAVGETQVAIAAGFGVSQSTISLIAVNARWSHVG